MNAAISKVVEFVSSYDATGVNVVELVCVMAEGNGWTGEHTRLVIGCALKSGQLGREGSTIFAT